MPDKKKTNKKGGFYASADHIVRADQNNRRIYKSN